MNDARSAIEMDRAHSRPIRPDKAVIGLFVLHVAISDHPPIQLVQIIISADRRVAFERLNEMRKARVQVFHYEHTAGNHTRPKIAERLYLMVPKVRSIIDHDQWVA